MDARSIAHDTKPGDYFRTKPGGLVYRVVRRTDPREDHRSPHWQVVCVNGVDPEHEYTVWMERQWVRISEIDMEDPNGKR